MFDLDSAKLTQGGKSSLNRISTQLKKYNQAIQISGHTDSQGSLPYNQTLSEKRARAVADFMIEKGIQTNRLSYKGYGEKLPLASNSTKVGRAQNRRVVIKFF